MVLLNGHVHSCIVTNSVKLITVSYTFCRINNFKRIRFKLNSVRQIFAFLIQYLCVFISPTLILFDASVLAADIPFVTGYISECLNVCNVTLKDLLLSMSFLTDELCTRSVVGRRARRH